ncbi:MAG: hypothetical protein P0S95_06330 [Rhabdochlamydiaceae bacterium]|nr:hypothetical protein [Candidatus Amphrikana amoebophyrae]
MSIAPVGGPQGAGNNLNNPSHQAVNAVLEAVFSSIHIVIENNQKKSDPHSYSDARQPGY